ncbi:hypothetical protein C8J56DRAFT_893126 [Mycena floridula]|nr:hypothetical protein C8J56DRAFT_893126 [Mycena floridula]
MSEQVFPVLPSLKSQKTSDANFTVTSGIEANHAGGRYETPLYVKDTEWHMRVDHFTAEKPQLKSQKCEIFRPNLGFLVFCDVQDVPHDPKSSQIKFLTLICLFVALSTVRNANSRRNKYKRWSLQQVVRVPQELRLLPWQDMGFMIQLGRVGNVVVKAKNKLWFTRLYQGFDEGPDNEAKCNTQLEHPILEVQSENS